MSTRSHLEKQLGALAAMGLGTTRKGSRLQLPVREEGKADLRSPSSRRALQEAKSAAPKNFGGTEGAFENTPTHPCPEEGVARSRASPWYNGRKVKLRGKKDTTQEQRIKKLFSWVEKKARKSSTLRTCIQATAKKGGDGGRMCMHTGQGRRKKTPHQSLKATSLIR